MLDEAQALSVEVLEQLRLLSNLETTTEKLLRIVLVGQPQLRELLAPSRARAAEPAHHAALAPRAALARETVAYVHHRLAVASEGPARGSSRAALRDVRAVLRSRRAPFRLATPDPRYLYLSPTHADALAHLRLVLTESSGFACITGDVGTGKTTLVRAFLAGLAPDVATAYVFNPALSSLELLQTINADLGLPARSTSKTTLLQALNTHLLAQREAGRRSVVVIDEAQALGLEVLEQLRLLSNLETDTEKLLRIVLLGQPQLRRLLLHPDLVQLNQRITLRWHIGPLTRGETAAYIHHRLVVASEGQARPIFTRPALRLVHRLAGGVPRLINMIAHRALVAAFAESRQRVPARIVRRAYAEIAMVPLPGAAPVRRAAWAAVGAGVCLGVITLAARELGPGRDRETPVADVADRTAVVAGVALVVEIPPPTVTTTTAQRPAAAPDLGERLAQLDGAASTRTALAAVLARWQARPPAAEESTTPADFASIARRRGLEHVVLTGNASMLRLLDLPAILELQTAQPDGARYVALVGLTRDRALVVIDGADDLVDASALERHWFGRAHVLWRDFEALGPGFLEPDASGDPVRKLQSLLRRAGAYGGPETGLYGTETTAAVLDFQRSRFLGTDARVGPLTRIMLYAAAGGYARPTLAFQNGDASWARFSTRSPSWEAAKPRATLDTVPAAPSNGYGRLAVGFATALVAGAGVALWLSRVPPPALPAPPAAASAPVPTRIASPSLPVAPPVPLPGASERPWGRRSAPRRPRHRSSPHQRVRPIRPRARRPPSASASSPTLRSRRAAASRSPSTAGVWQSCTKARAPEAWRVIRILADRVEVTYAGVPLSVRAQN